MNDQYRRLIRASELVRWAYCRRAWWLQYVRGHEPANPEPLVRGQEFHKSHRRYVERADLYRQFALLAGLAGLGVVLIAIALISLSL